VHGPIATLGSRIIHDDWKSTEQWLAAQVRYMQRELDQMQVRKGGFAGWLRRKPPLMPMAMFLYCLFGKGLLLNGRAGIFYALQRTMAEAVLSLMVLEQRLRGCADGGGADRTRSTSTQDIQKSDHAGGICRELLTDGGQNGADPGCR